MIDYRCQAAAHLSRAQEAHRRYAAGDTDAQEAARVADGLARLCLVFAEEEEARNSSASPPIGRTYDASAKPAETQALPTAAPATQARASKPSAGITGAVRAAGRI